MIYQRILVARGGIEPPTRGFSVRYIASSDVHRAPPSFPKSLKPGRFQSSEAYHVLLRAAGKLQQLQHIESGAAAGRLRANRWRDGSSARVGAARAFAHSAAADDHPRRPHPHARRRTRTQGEKASPQGLDCARIVERASSPRFRLRWSTCGIIANGSEESSHL
jgi:hypothetical protein